MKYVKASGAKIKAARKAAGLTQVELGAKMGVTGSMIGQYETEARRPSINTAKEISEILGVSLDSLMVTFDADLSPVPSYTKLVLKENLDVKSVYCGSLADTDAENPMLERMRIAFDLLNDEGRAVAVERVEELTEIPKYQADKKEPAPE